MQLGLEIFLNILVAFGCIFSFIVGIFGNCMIIAAIYKKKDLRQKAGILLAITSASHNISLTCELANAYYSIVIIFAQDVPRKNCYIMMFPYMFTFLHQAGMYFVSILDLLFAIIFPIWYSRINLKKYIMLMTIFPNMVGFFMLLTTIMTFKNDLIMRCNPYTVVVEPFGDILFAICAIINSCTLFVFVITLIVFRMRRTKTNLAQVSQVLRRIGVTAITFTCSFFVGSYGAVTLANMQLPIRDRLTFQAIFVLPAVAAYSSNFSACWFRSEAYRRAFCEILGLRKYAPNPNNSNIMSRTQNKTSHHRPTYQI